MTLFAILLVAFNSALCIYMFARKRAINSPFQFFFLALLAVGIFPSFFDLQVGVYEIHPFAPSIYLTPEVIGIVHLKIAAMLATFIAFDLMMGVDTSKRIVLERATSNINAYDGVVAILVSVLAFGIYTFGFAYLSGLSFGELRFGGTVSTYSLLLLYLQLLVVGVPAVYWLKCNRKLSAVAVMMLFIITFLFLGGSRQTVVMGMAVFIAMFFTGRGKWTYAVLIIAFTVGFSFADTVLQAVKAFRNLPSLDARMALVGDLITGQANLEGVSTEASLRFVMYGFLSEPLPADFGNFSYFQRALLFWLPSVIDVAELKPADFEYAMFAHAMGNRVGTMHPVFFGSIFADAGWLFFVWIAWFTLGFRLLETLMLKFPPLERAMVWSSCIYLSFMVARGSLYGPLVVISVVLLVAWLSTFTRRLMTGDEPTSVHSWAGPAGNAR